MQSRTDRIDWRLLAAFFVVTAAGLILRSIYGGMPLPSRKQIERRVQTCAALFLDGCRAA